MRGVVANFARPPQGADTTLLQSVAAGECAVTLANHYYYVRLQTSKVRGEQDAAKKLTPIFPDQDGMGTHVNISGAGIMASAPHKANAIKFLEFMASDKAQNIVANANYEFPAVDLDAALERACDARRVQDRSAERRHLRRQPGAGSGDLRSRRLALVASRPAFADQRGLEFVDRPLRMDRLDPPDIGLERLHVVVLVEDDARVERPDRLLERRDDFVSGNGL